MGPARRTCGPCTSHTTLYNPKTSASCQAHDYQHLNRTVSEASIEDLLTEVSEESEGGQGCVEIRYRHSGLAQVLIDAGIISISRAYPRAEDWHKDPFALPKAIRRLPHCGAVWR